MFTWFTKLSSVIKLDLFWKQVFSYTVFRKNSAISYTDDATPTCFGWLGLLNTNRNISICAGSSKEGLVSVFAVQNCKWFCQNIANVNTTWLIQAPRSPCTDRHKSIEKDS